MSDFGELKGHDPVAEDELDAKTEKKQAKPDPVVDDPAPAVTPPPPASG
jgi:hypothetical protein